MLRTQPVLHTPLSQSAIGDNASTPGPLESLALRLAKSHEVSPRFMPGFPLVARLRHQETLLRAGYRHFSAAAETQLDLSSAGDWLLDNFYQVQEAIRQVREDMPAGYYRRLPKLNTPAQEYYPRIYLLARGIIEYSESHLHLDQVTRFVQAYQQLKPLKIGEIWALPTMLRLGILESLTRAVAYLAGLSFDLSPTRAAHPGEDSLAAVPQSGAQRSAHGTASPQAGEEPAKRAAAEAAVANCILSLRMLATKDWKTFFESVSQVDQALRSDPANIYTRMSFETRDWYRQVVEELALATGRDEVEVAQEALALARNKAALRARLQRDGQNLLGSAHVGYCLVDSGRVELEARLGYRPKLSWRLRHWLLANATPVYLGGIAALTLAMLLGLTLYASTAGGTLFQLLGASLFALVPAITVAVDVVDWLVVRSVPPRRWPRMDFTEGIPAEFRTMVVIPSLLTTADEVESLLHQLELYFLGNTDPHLHFALLTDFADAPQKNMPDDSNLLEQAKEGIRALNVKHRQQRAVPGGEPPPEPGLGEPDRLFYLFHRERKYNPGENCWMGWERKRGKLAEFDRLLRGSRETTYNVQMGDLTLLPDVKFVITLDADTVLPPGSARRLIAALAHPLNRAEFEADSGVVVAGYTVLQPRLQVKSTSANRSLFTQVFAGDTSLDLYTRAISDVYQDLFGEGNYVGKGIYDVDAFERSLEGHAPENILLSHDLFEGIHGRAGLVTDVILFEDYPPHYLSYAHRLHRWVRGDWQLLPWLLPKVPHAGGGRIANRLSVLDRWKLLDNLRRSLLTPALLTLLIAGWLWLPGSALYWTLAGLLPLALPIILGTIPGWFHSLNQKVPVDATRPMWAGACRSLLTVAFLPYEALIIADAVVTVLVRLAITRTHRLQWTTVAHTVRLFGGEMRLTPTWRRMIGAPVLAAGFALLLSLFNPAALPVAAPLLLAWLASPQIAHWISRPIVHRRVPLSANERQQLRWLARRTWLFFEQFVGPEDHWLPPDHFQEDPRELVAHRTSPTNVGLLLLSSLAAHDLGYIGPLSLSLRLSGAFSGMEALERHRGHFLNWYDTRSLAPLPPRYVSVVDSGNLAACLLALRQGCQEVLQTPVLGWQRWQGVQDTLDILADAIDKAHLGAAAAPFQAYLARIRQRMTAVRDEPERWAPLLANLCAGGQGELDHMLVSLLEASTQTVDAATVHSLNMWAELAHHHLLNEQRELDLLLPWLAVLGQPPALFTQLEPGSPLATAWQALVDTLPSTPRLDNLGYVCRAGLARLAHLRELLADGHNPTSRVILHSSSQPLLETQPQLRPRRSFIEPEQEARDWCMQLSQKLESARKTAETLVISYQDLIVRAEDYFQKMDFSFLFDNERCIFHIGYNVEAGKLDDNCYDLLASEARLASLLAIAKGDVPLSHWLHLARPLTRVDHAQALLSWGGTMFEYLMPTLLARSDQNTLMDQSCRAVIKHQIAYGRQTGVPWGVSESGYFSFDDDMNYQYQAFGVPGLGFKRGLADDLVISPYASLLALPICPQAVMRNIGRLIALKMLGRFGFYEAIDFTPARQSSGRKGATVCSYMAHHQGMILLALTNYLEDAVMVHRFHADPRVQSVELLLQEQMPRQVPTVYPHPEEVPVVPPLRAHAVAEPWSPRTDLTLPQVHCLSNGSYSLVITSAGSGYSHWQEVDLTRWRADTTLDDWGTWIYVKDLDSGALWSAGYQPTAAPPESQMVLFYPHKAQFYRREHDVSLRMEITVPPDDDVEIRRIGLTNHSGRPRRLMLISYAEVVLAPQVADQRHPAFNKLFIESEYRPEAHALLFGRRPRSAEEEPIYLVHSLVMEEEADRRPVYECDRGQFLGRGGTSRSPIALSKEGGGLSGQSGATLDPIMALGQEIELAPHATARIAFVTAAATSREGALAVALWFQVWPRIMRAFDRALSHSEAELKQFYLTALEIERFQQLLSVLLYPHAALRAAAATLAANSKGQPGLWPYTISGDNPIILVRASSQEEIGLVRELLKAHRYWRSRQIKIDLVILNMRDTGYEQELQVQLRRLIAHNEGDAWLQRRGGIFLLRADQMSEADRILVETAARAILDAGQGSLTKQLERLSAQPVRLPHFVPTLSIPEDVEPTPPLQRVPDLLFDNGLGGFSADGREYVIYLESGRSTPAPWINVIANPHFGFLVSEAGMGYSWAENSGENRLTSWRNDPVTDAPGEALYLRDEETGQVWSPTPLPARAVGPYLVRHGAGYSTFEHHSHGLKQRLRLFAVPDAPVKVVQLQLENTSSRTRRITATYFAEWVLGPSRDVMTQYIVPEFDAIHNAVLARNPYNVEFGLRVAFLASTRQLHSLTADRTEFLGRMGSYGQPAALDRVGLTATVRAGLDPCAAVQSQLWLAPGQAKEITFLLGQGADREDALRLIQQYQNVEQIDLAWQRMAEFWESLLGTVTVQTPDPAMNLLLNRWLLYQTLSCRVWGRSAFYQSSGAFGYRDQLQDVMALVHAAPDVIRDHILEAARHQFEAGDVLHWWHPPVGRGVRTRCSDDLLWLPYVTAYYVAATGDLAILREQILFLKGEPLKAWEKEQYGQFDASSEADTLFTHCCRALDKGLTAGPHGLPLIGSGDWNDGLNRVGIKGQGESVWLGWFLYATLTRFAAVCELVAADARAASYLERAEALRQALEANAWDGSWYRRAYYDDGTPLGAAENKECQIDSIAQSWAILSGAADRCRASIAMESVTDRLVRPDDQLILLLAPPFDKTLRDPGYIKGYAPGIRENGGQYTHAALWAVWAFAELGQGDYAETLFRLLNPIYHSDTPEKVSRYRVEPYVVAADVYSASAHIGRGGWTWYTGSASWMYRLGLERILGLHRVENGLRLDPCIPRDWPAYEIAYRIHGSLYQIHVENPASVNSGVRQVEIDGEMLPGGEIPLLNDGKQHTVRVWMGQDTSARMSE